jgi:hypothetical protein
MFDREVFINLLIKVGLPAAIGISIKLAVQSKRERMSFIRVIMSFIIGIGCAYLAFPIIQKNATEDLVPLFIAMVSISSEKISEYFIYKWNIDYFLTSIIEAFRQVIIKLISKN